ncbi:MAG: 50S ribosomal protein L22 [Peptococcaceae bacterium]|nr:50S ribosomal protein L22 [Peptococcaceae bacterium]
METRAVAKYVRVSPRKARLVADLIRGKQVDEALAILRALPQMSKEPVVKTLKSAVANAENNNDAVADDLYVTNIFIDQGPTLKRIKPRAQGRADRINKRTSHITVLVGDKEED